MLIPILVIALTFLNLWLLTLLLTPAFGVWYRAQGKPGKRFTLPDQGVSLWSFVLLLFTGSPKSSQSTRSHRPEIAPEGLE